MGIHGYSMHNSHPHCTLRVNATGFTGEQVNSDILFSFKRGHKGLMVGVDFFKWVDGAL